MIVDLKLQAFRIVTVVKLVLLHYDNELKEKCDVKQTREKPEPKPPWKHDFPTWSVLPLWWTRFHINKVIELPDNSPVEKNSAGHLGAVPEFWTTAVKEFTAYMGKYIPTSLTKDIRLKTLKALTTKKVYDRLADEQNATTWVPAVRKSPLSNYDQQWLDCNSAYLRPFLRNFIFRCAHETLPTNVKCNPVTEETIITPSILQSRRCILCKNESETLGHALLACEQHTNTWGFIEDKLFDICNHRLRVNEEVLFRGGFPSTMERRKLGLFLLYSTAACIWKVRNEAQKENKTGNVAVRVANSLRYEIMLQAEVDREHLSHTDFESLWLPHVCQPVTQGGRLIFEQWVENINQELANRIHQDSSMSLETSSLSTRQTGLVLSSSSSSSSTPSSPSPPCSPQGIG